MGLFDFLKGKSKVDKPPMPPPTGDLPSLTDLPPIDGSSLPPMPTGLPEAPMMNTSPEPMASKNAPGSLTVNLPPLDFTLPPKEEGAPVENPQQQNSLPTFLPPDENPERGTLQSLEPHKSSDQYIDLSDDINQLFPADASWHEPDWNTFMPYPEPEIEPPKPADFGLEPMPELPTASVESDLPSFEVDSQSRSVSDAPVNVFVRGKDYARVHTELDKINFLLSNQEPRILSLFEEVLSKEEELLKKSKDNMEYVYRRLSIVDKRIFG